MAFENLYESKPMQKLQEFGGKMQANKVCNAITGGMMGVMSMILAGAVFMVIATLLNLAGIVQTSDAIYQWLNTPYNMTMNILSVAVAFSVGYAYSKNLELGGTMANGIVTMVLFLLVAAPMQTVTLAGDEAATMTVLDTSFLGGTGLFTALIMPIISVRIIKFCQDKHITLRMPDSVPQFLQDSFAALVPLVINIVLWHGLNTLCEMAFTVTLPAAIMGLLAAPLAALVNGPAIILLVIICMLLWSVGIHGTGVVYTVLLPVIIQATAANAELVAANQAPVFAPVFLFGVIATCGGTGNMLPLAIMCTRAKSEQLRAVGKAGLVPAIFNISEPMAFGVPVMYNPLIAIPFVINVVITVLIVWVFYAIGFFQAPYILILTALPIFLANFANSMAWQNLLIVPIAFVVGWLVYYPFFKMYDKQLLEQEQGSQE